MFALLANGLGLLAVSSHLVVELQPPSSVTLPQLEMRLGMSVCGHVDVLQVLKVSDRALLGDGPFALRQSLQVLCEKMWCGGGAAAHLHNPTASPPS